MTDLQRMTRFAQNRAGTNNKFYEVEARELEDGKGQWIFRWGRIGTTGQSKTGQCHSYNGAVFICNEQFEKKESRGYEEANAMEALAAAVQDVEERKNNGHPPVEIEVPCFHAGKSEERCKAFAEKYLAKLNLIRGSRWDLGDTKYRNQIEAMLKGYCAEYARMLKTNAHGHLARNSNADTAFRIFFGDLVDNAKISVYGYFEGVGVR